MDKLDDLLRRDLFKVGPEQELRLTSDGMTFYYNLFKAHNVSMNDIATLPDLLEAIAMVIESQAEYMAELPDAYQLSSSIQAALGQNRRFEIARKNIAERKDVRMGKGFEAEALDDVGREILPDVADLMQRLRLNF